MLLYLISNTWQAAADGSESPLVAEVMSAQNDDIRLVMVHEADEGRDGCEFDRLFQTT